MIDLHLGANAPRWRLLYAVRIDAYLATSFCPCLTTYLCLFLVRFAFFLLFRYTLGKRWKKAQLDAGLPTKTYCNRGAVSIDLENLFETAPAFGACFIALFLF